jgi:serine/threonine protein phosphatase PrpC
MAAAVIPHPEKAHYGGEDAYFITTDGASALGVCDGVGGWASDGLSSRDYALGILAECQQRLPPSGQADEVGEGLRSCMFHAHSQVRHAAAPSSRSLCVPLCSTWGCRGSDSRGSDSQCSTRRCPALFAGRLCVR